MINFKSARCILMKQPTSWHVHLNQMTQFNAVFIGRILCTETVNILLRWSPNLSNLCFEKQKCTVIFTMLTDFALGLLEVRSRASSHWPGWVSCLVHWYTRAYRTLREHTVKSFVAIVIHTLQIWASLNFLGNFKVGTWSCGSTPLWHSSISSS